jgi:hypothetical protein
MNSKMIETWEEAVKEYVKVLSKYLPGEKRN